MKILNKIKRKLFKKFLNFFKQELFEQYHDNMFIILDNLKSRGYSPKTILDIGAYKGGWTSEMTSIYPNANYIMFEAQENKKKYLDNVVLHHDNVEYHIGLLGSTIAKDKEFYLMETGSSILYENTNHSREVVHLDMNTVDNILINKTISDSCFLKIDVQGYEIEVLKGTKETLKNVDLILLEVSILEFNEGSPLINEILNFMETIGFVTYDISSLKRTSKEKALFQLDIFFCKKDSFLRTIKSF